MGNLVQARTKFNRLLAMVDDLNGDQKQALSVYWNSEIFLERSDFLNKTQNKWYI